jgi:hypothetical protein
VPFYLVRKTLFLVSIMFSSIESLASNGPDRSNQERAPVENENSATAFKGIL